MVVEAVGFQYFFFQFFKSRRIDGDLIKGEFYFWIFFLVWCLFYFFLFNDDCGKTVNQSIERIKRQVIPFVIFLFSDFSNNLVLTREWIVSTTQKKCWFILEVIYVDILRYLWGKKEKNGKKHLISFPC